MNSLLSGLTSPMVLNRGFEFTQPMFRYPESAFRATGRLLPTEPVALAGIGENAMRPTEPPQLMPFMDQTGENAVVPLPAMDVPRAPDPATIYAQDNPMGGMQTGRLQNLLSRMKQSGGAGMQTMRQGAKTLGERIKRPNFNRDMFKPVLEEEPLRTQVTNREYVADQPFRYGRYA